MGLTQLNGGWVCLGGLYPPKHTQFPLHCVTSKGKIMNIDTGLGVVIVAVLIFYLRLIILQRQRARSLIRPAVANAKNKGKAKEASTVSPQRFSILSNKTSDRLVAGIGVLLILAGLLLNAKILPFLTAQPYWWIPTAIGIVAFSWAFRL